MKRIAAFQTADGEVHANHLDAVKHARKQYDDTMTKLRHALTLSHGLIGIQEGLACMSWIEENFDRIAHAAALKVDADIVEDTLADDD